MNGRLKNSLLMLTGVLFLMMPFVVAAQDGDPVEVMQEREIPEVDVKSLVFGHLGDAYEWHITSWGDRHYTIPLPMIVMSKDRVLHLFSSARITHGGEYEGFYIAGKDSKFEDKIVALNEAGEEIRPFDISITKNVLSLLMSCGLLLFLVLYTARWYKKRPGEVPGGVRGLIEYAVATLEEQLIKPCIGEDYRRYSPYLLTAFFFIFLNNLLGLIPVFPGGANLTGNIAVTLVLAMFTFVIVNISGTKEYWKDIFWPDVPVWLKFPIPLMPAIELIGMLTKPFTLTIRLFANIMAGHSIILGLSCVIFLTASMGPALNIPMTAVSVVFSIFMNVVELIVAFIQAYVFTMLSAVFIGQARAKPHKAKHKETGR